MAVLICHCASSRPRRPCSELTSGKLRTEQPKDSQLFSGFCLTYFLSWTEAAQRCASAASATTHSWTNSTTNSTLNRVRCKRLLGCASHCVIASSFHLTRSLSFLPQNKNGREHVALRTALRLPLQNAHSEALPSREPPYLPCAHIFHSKKNCLVRQRRLDHWRREYKDLSSL